MFAQKNLKSLVAALVISAVAPTAAASGCYAELEFDGRLVSETQAKDCCEDDPSCFVGYPLLTIQKRQRPTGARPWYLHLAINGSDAHPVTYSTAFAFRQNGTEIQSCHIWPSLGRSTIFWTYDSANCTENPRKISVYG